MERWKICLNVSIKHIKTKMTPVLRNKYVRTTLASLLTLYCGKSYVDFFSSLNYVVPPADIVANAIFIFWVYATIFSAIGAIHSWLEVLKLKL